MGLLASQWEKIDFRLQNAAAACAGFAGSLTLWLSDIITGDGVSPSNQSRSSEVAPVMIDVRAPLSPQSGSRGPVLSPSGRLSPTDSETTKQRGVACVNSPQTVKTRGSGISAMPKDSAPVAFRRCQIRWIY